MDEFGVLTERYGLKSQGKSAPMSQAKRSSATTTTATLSTKRNFGFESGLTRNSTSSSSSKSSWNSSASNGSLLDDHDFFPKRNSQNSFGFGDDYGYEFGGFENLITKQSNTSNNSSNGSLLDDHDFFPKRNSQNSFGFGDDYGYEFGGFENLITKQSNTSNNSSNGSSFDLASMLLNSGPKSSTANSYVVDDLFGGMSGSQNASNDDNFGFFASSTKQKGSVGDLLGDFSGVAAKLKNSRRNGSWDSGKNEAGVDDLIPGFGGSSPPVNRTNVKATKSTFKSTGEPFVVLESDLGSEYNSSKAPTEPLEEFTMFNQFGGTKPHGSSNASPSLRPPPKPAQVLKANKVKSSGASPIDELEDFAMGRVHNKDPMFDANIPNRQQKKSAGASPTEKKASSATMTNGIDDFSFIFGAAPMFGEFEEVSGESEERRRARLERHQRTQDRVARAVADMNQRDRQTQNDQEERRRIAEAMDFEIKRWAAGKEGNMRALLSSLQLVLWSECGWDPVSLTDLITSGSVKKVYRKATLCVHPDKVQQKGATLEQKYIAEKVFDILKEAWNKFNKEELS